MNYQCTPASHGSVQHPDGRSNFPTVDVRQCGCGIQEAPQTYVAATTKPTTTPRACTPTPPHKQRAGMGTWTEEEHARFLEAVKLFPNCPWKHVAAYVGTRTVRQTMTHAQKCRQKAARHMRGLRTRQARMRMQSGHRLSDDSLLQERLRVYDACSASRQLCEPIPYTYTSGSVVPGCHRTQHIYRSVSMPTLEMSKAETVAHGSFDASSLAPPPPDSPEQRECGTPSAHGDAFAAKAQEGGPLGGLATSPSLDECASVLFDLFF